MSRARAAAFAVALLALIGLLIGVGVASSGRPGAAQRPGPQDAPTAPAGEAQRDGVPTPSVDRFDAARAFGLARLQVRVGPRPAGSAALRRLAMRLRGLLPNGRLEPVPGGLRNVVGRIPGRQPAILIAAHYDTKQIPGFVGANDAAAGTAVVLELARVLRAGRRAGDPEIRFALFDGEESPDDRLDFVASGLRGSKAYLRAHRARVGAVIVVDFVGQRGLSLPREAGSHEPLWQRLRGAAARVGVGSVFPPVTVGEVLDDHTPFARAGVPAIDLIDFSYPHFHLPSDTLDKLSPRSLDAVGEALVELVRGLGAADVRALRA